MEKRVAVIGIIVEDPESVEAINAILHEHAAYILGRMGVPYRARGSTSSASRSTRRRT
jgi:putative iron-only hydrogenase system regulator